MAYILGPAAYWISLDADVPLFGLSRETVWPCRHPVVLIL